MRILSHTTPHASLTLLYDTPANPKLEKTLIQCNFEVGDYLDLVYISPPAPLPSSNPSTLYSDRNTSTNRLPPLAPGRNQPFAPRNSFPTGPGGARDRAGPPQGSRNGNAIGGGRGDGNAPAGAWGRNAPGGGGRDERGRDGPPHKADTWAPTARGNGRASFDSRDVRSLSPLARSPLTRRNARTINDDHSTRQTITTTDAPLAPVPPLDVPRTRIVDPLLARGRDRDLVRPLRESRTILPLDRRRMIALGRGRSRWLEEMSR